MREEVLFVRDESGIEWRMKSDGEGNLTFCMDGDVEAHLKRCAQAREQSPYMLDGDGVAAAFIPTAVDIKLMLEHGVPFGSPDPDVTAWKLKYIQREMPAFWANGKHRRLW